jgi:hypothetical protein
MKHTGSFTAFVERDGALGTVAHSKIRFLKQLPIDLQARITLERHRGHFERPNMVGLKGDARVLGLKAEVVFRMDHGPVAGLQEQRAAVELLPMGHTFAICAQSALLAMPKDSDLWVLTPDPSRRPPWHHQHAGTCNFKLLNVHRNIPVEATIDLTFVPVEARNGHQAGVEMSGEIRFERDVRMRLMLHESLLAEAPAPEFESVELTLLPAGSFWTIDRRSVSGDVGPNPWISVRVLEAGRRPLCDEQTLGRSMRIP